MQITPNNIAEQALLLKYQKEGKSGAEASAALDNFRKQSGNQGSYQQNNTNTSTPSPFSGASTDMYGSNITPEVSTYTGPDDQSNTALGHRFSDQTVSKIKKTSDIMQKTSEYVKGHLSNAYTESGNVFKAMLGDKSVRSTVGDTYTPSIMHAVGQVGSAFGEAAAGLISAASNQSGLTPKVQSLTKDAVSFLDKYAPSVKQGFLDAVSGTAEGYAAFQKAHPNIAQAISDTFDASQLWGLVPIKKAGVMTGEELGNLITKAGSAVEKGAEAVAPALDVAGNVGKMAGEGAVNLATSTAEKVASIPGNIATATKEAVTKRWADIAKEKAKDVIIPVEPSPKELEQYVSAIKYDENILGNLSELHPTDFVQQVIDEAAPVLFPHSKSLPTNKLGITSKKKLSERLSTNLGVMSDSLGEALEKTKGGYIGAQGKAQYKQDIMKNIRKAMDEEGVPFATDPNMEIAFDKLMSEHFKYIDSIPDNSFGNKSIWEGRIDFDGLLKGKFKNMFNQQGGGSVLQQAGMATRNAINQTLTDALGSDIYKNYLRSYHLKSIAKDMIDSNIIATQNLGKGLFEIGVQYARKHGTLSGLAIAAGTGISAAMSAPILIGLGLGFGSASAAQLIWAKTRNNPSFRNSIRKLLLKEIEKPETPDVIKDRTRKMIETLDSDSAMKKEQERQMKLIEQNKSLIESEVKKGVQPEKFSGHDNEGKSISTKTQAKKAAIKPGRGLKSLPSPRLPE